SSLLEPRSLPGSRRARPHRPRQFHRARRGLRARRYAGRKAPHAIAIPDGHWRRKSVCRRLRRLPHPARTGEGSPPAQTPGDSRRHGREFSSADCESGSGCQEDGRVERIELWTRLSAVSSVTTTPATRNEPAPLAAAPKDRVPKGAPFSLLFNIPEISLQ